MTKESSDKKTPHKSGFSGISILGIELLAGGPDGGPSGGPDGGPSGGVGGPDGGLGGVGGLEGGVGGPAGGVGGALLTDAELGA